MNWRKSFAVRPVLLAASRVTTSAGGQLLIKGRTVVGSGAGQVSGGTLGRHREREEVGVQMSPGCTVSSPEFRPAWRPRALPLRRLPSGAHPLPGPPGPLPSGCCCLC